MNNFIIVKKLYCICCLDTVINILLNLFPASTLHSSRLSLGGMEANEAADPIENLIKINQSF